MNFSVGAAAGMIYMNFSFVQEPDEGQKLREQHLRQFSFFQLRIHLKRGQNLIAMDKNGESFYNITPPKATSPHTLWLAVLMKSQSYI